MMTKEVIEGQKHSWRVIRDLATDKSTLEVVKDLGVYSLPDINLTTGTAAYEWYSNQNDDFHSVEGLTLWKQLFKRDDWETRTTASTRLTCDKDNFYIHAQLDAYQGKERVFSKNYNHTIPRQLV